MVVCSHLFYCIGKFSIRRAKEWPKAILWSGAVFSCRFSTLAGAQIGMQAFLSRFVEFCRYMSNSCS